MPKKLPILVIIPHGGYAVPQELKGLEAVTLFDLFFNADTCANEIFDFRETAAAVLDTSVSRLFIDCDRDYRQLPPKHQDGVMREKTFFGNPVFTDGVFPDELALSNLVERYHLTFQETIRKLLSTGSIKMVVECHTMMSAAPPLDRDHGSPRSLVSVHDRIPGDPGKGNTASRFMTETFLRQLQKHFSREEGSISAPFTRNDPRRRGYLIREFGTGAVPYLRLELSRALFLSDRWFDQGTLSVKEERILSIRERTWKAIEFTFHRFFG
jgi:N-formylglutamate amidohydrolase